MSTTFEIVREGDTFERFARRIYGTEGEAERIRIANPGASEPLTAGVVLVAPALPSLPPLQPPAPAETGEETALLVNGQRFRFWSDIRITRTLDSMDTLGFSAPFDPADASVRATFRPLSFQPAQVTVGGEPLFTGTLVNVNPRLEPKERTVDVSGYSIPGVMGDCTAPASAYTVEASQLEFNGQSLREIATTLAGLFSVGVVFDGDPGEPIERVALSATDRVLSFLIAEAQQQNLVVSSTPTGQLLFQQSAAPGVPVARLVEGSSPLVTVTPFFSPQEYYSDITGIEPVGTGTAGSQFTVPNPRLLGVLRPLTFQASDVQAGGIVDAVQSKAGRMFASAISYRATVATWRDGSGNLWRPNTTVSLLAPGAMVYNEFDFILRGIEFIRSGKSETAVLDLMLPGALSGQIPEVLPWDG